RITPRACRLRPVPAERDLEGQVMSSVEFRELFRRTLAEVKRELQDPDSEASRELDAAISRVAARRQLAIQQAAVAKALNRQPRKRKSKPTVKRNVKRN